MRAALGFLLVLVAAGAAFALYAWKPAIDPIEPSTTAAADPALIRRGQELASIGNCNVCHTKPGGQPYAGGLPIETPFGTIHSTNITPDPETGIGRWPEEAFVRSMREGVDREGNHLYPAFPYDHFTLVSEEDNRALYAFLMTRDAVRSETPAHDLPFPLNIRAVIAGWNLLFLRKGPHEPDPGQSAQWNRGAYLVEGLGHCGACHTPRNALGAEKKDEMFSGGMAEGWYAYAINSASPAPVPWTAEKLHFYLRNGWHEQHGISRGAMAPVTTNLAAVSDEDVRAIAVYVASIMGEPSAEARQRGETAMAAAASDIGGQPPTQTSDSQTSPDESTSAAGNGQVLFEATCASCHDGRRPLPYGGINLHLSTAVNAPDPTNIINVVLHGLPPMPGEASPIMPGYRSVMTDENLTSLLAYLRTTFSDQPAWTDLENRVREAREAKVAISPNDGATAAPADPSARTQSW